MAFIRVDVGYTIHDGTEIKFRSPADCSAIIGLKVYYPIADGRTVSTVFALTDAHGNGVGNVDNLFAENVVVKVILDVTNNTAYIQNADTNTYLEEKLAGLDEGKAPSGYGLGKMAINMTTLADANAATNTGWYRITADTTHGIGSAGIMRVEGVSSTYCIQTAIQSSSGIELRRSLINGSWSEWGYVNPPKTVGVEYLTTEKWLGLPVYAKTFEVTMSNGGTIDVTGGYRIIRLEGFVQSRGTLPIIINNGNLSDAYSAYLKAESNKITMYCGSSMSKTAWITAYYVKN